MALPSRIVFGTSRISLKTEALNFGIVLYGGGYALKMHDSYDPRAKKLRARVRRLRGQGEGIERALESHVGCDQIMHLIAGARGAMTGLMAELVEDHVRSHLVNPFQQAGALNTEAAEQLLDVVRTYLK